MAALPIVTESPHAWFPREFYRQGRYIYPLDWDVVLKYPRAASNNATDFHIMQRFRSWSGEAGILTTDEILKSYPEFLVLNQPTRSWLRNLMSTQHVVAKPVSRAGKCLLWHVQTR
jgi:hypothetical protein